MQSRDNFSIISNMKVYFVLSLESPHRGESNYNKNIPFSIKKNQKKKKQENHPKLSQICSYGIFSKGLKNEFETAVVKEPSVFEPLKFYCTFLDFLSAIGSKRIVITKAKFTVHLNSVAHLSICQKLSDAATVVTRHQPFLNFNI